MPSCDGRRIKPPAKRQRLAEELNAVHEVKVEEFTGTDTCEFVVHDVRWLDRRLSDKRKRHIPAKTSLKSKNGTDYNQREHFQFNELCKKKLSK